MAIVARGATTVRVALPRTEPEEEEEDEEVEELDGRTVEEEEEEGRMEEERCDGREDGATEPVLVRGRTVVDVDVVDIVVALFTFTNYCRTMMRKVRKIEEDKQMERFERRTND